MTIYDYTKISFSHTSFVCTFFLFYIVVAWLRHYATSQKVAGSNPDEVDFFNLPNPSSRTVALWLTQRLAEMSTRNLPGG
jgi:hypothetical protein